MQTLYRLSDDVLINQLAATQVFHATRRIAHVFRTEPPAEKSVTAPVMVFASTSFPDVTVWMAVIRTALA
jgi:hypothetical protein